MSGAASVPWCSECAIVVQRVDEDGCCLACGTDVLEHLGGYPRSFRRAVARGRYARAAWLETRHADRWLARLAQGGVVRRGVVREESGP